jgi:poly(A) polymerase Pap1
MESRKSQSFTLGEVAIAIEILKAATRNKDLKSFVQREDFVTLYRKFLRMMEKIKPGDATDNLD